MRSSRCFVSKAFTDELTITSYQTSSIKLFRIIFLSTVHTAVMFTTNGNEDGSVRPPPHVLNTFLKSIFRLLFSVSNVVDTVGVNASHLSKKTSIVVATQQPITMTTLAASQNSIMSSSVNVSPTSSVKKQRPKTLSPTRHGGPQQCQVTRRPYICFSSLTHQLVKTHSVIGLQQSVWECIGIGEAQINSQR